MLRVRHGAIVCALWLVGCPAGPTPPPAKGEPTKTAAKPADTKTSAGNADPKKPAETKKAVDAGPMGKTLATAPIPWDKLIGADPPTAESFLGEPAAKGGHKDSCVRFVPDRTWFKCRNVIRAVRALIPNSPDLNWQRAYDYLVHGEYDFGEDT
ncbi:MAG: hypothetical protein AAF721_34995, partial [Myxococcota bacterium]